MSKLRGVAYANGAENIFFLYSFRTKDTPKLGLLLVILGVIFMNGNRASEGEWLDL